MILGKHTNAIWLSRGGGAIMPSSLPSRNIHQLSKLLNRHKSGILNMNRIVFLCCSGLIIEGNSVDTEVVLPLPFDRFTCIAYQYGNLSPPPLSSPSPFPLSGLCAFPLLLYVLYIVLWRRSVLFSASLELGSYGALLRPARRSLMLPLIQIPRL